jgi:hypothetical protein
MKTSTKQAAVPALADTPAQADSVDRSGAIRTLTHEEMAVVSGGLSPAILAGLRSGTLWGTPLYYSLTQPHYTYRPSRFPSSLSNSNLSFLRRVFLDSSEWANAGAISFTLQN